MKEFNHKPRDHFRSNEEWYFSWWLDDMLDYGYIKSWEYESEKFTLSDSFKQDYYKKTRNSEKKSQFSYLLGCTYQPDFKVIWDESAKGLFYYNMEDKSMLGKSDLPYFAAQEDITRIEIKPNHDFQNN